MTGDNIRRNITEERARGDECLNAAVHLLGGGFYNDAISRAYYAALHYARALLLTKDIEPKTHRGTIQLVSLHFVKDGPLPPEFASDFSHLETYRELSDYNSATEFTEAVARDEIARARRFIGHCLPLLPAN